MSSSQNSRVIDPSGISYAVTNGHKDGEPKIIERNTPIKGNYTEPRICTMIGRDPNNPSSRARSEQYEQMLELGDDVSNTLTSVQKDNLIAGPICLNSKVNGKQPSLEDRIYDVNGTSTCITTCFHPNIAEPLRIPQATEKGYIELEPGGLFDGSYPNSTTRRGRVQNNGKSSPTLTANGEPPNLYEGKVEQSYRIRKLTPRECFRLMGVSETDIDKIQQSGVSQTQQYKMAGNSIVVDVLEHIFRKMFVDTGQESQQLSIF